MSTTVYKNVFHRDIESPNVLFISFHFNDSIIVESTNTAAKMKRIQKSKIIEIITLRNKI